jgi:hydroxymethylbilane synthase
MRAHRVGTRASALARWQTDNIVALWRRRDPDAQIEIVELTTDGDQLADAPLERSEGTGFFTSTLERALLDDEIDVAVHSYKDLPVETTAALTIAATPARGPVEDALCARDGLRLDTLPVGARVGTSSPRRTAQLRALRPDLDFRPVRGNVPTRVQRVATGHLDAVVLATAGLARLELLHYVSETFPIERILTAPAQGAIAVQVREADASRRRALGALEDSATRLAVEAERALLHGLRGGCSVPVGAHAVVRGTRIVLSAGVFAPAGDRALRVEMEGADPESLGTEAARRLLEQGAAEVLAEVEREPRVTWERTR